MVCAPNVCSAHVIAILRIALMCMIGTSIFMVLPSRLTRLSGSKRVSAGCLQTYNHWLPFYPLSSTSKLRLRSFLFRFSATFLPGVAKNAGFTKQGTLEQLVGDLLILFFTVFVLVKLPLSLNLNVLVSLYLSRFANQGMATPLTTPLSTDSA